MYLQFQVLLDITYVIVWWIIIISLGLRTAHFIAVVQIVIIIFISVLFVVYYNSEITKDVLLKVLRDLALVGLHFRCPRSIWNLQDGANQLFKKGLVHVFDYMFGSYTIVLLIDLSGQELEAHIILIGSLRVQSQTSANVDVYIREFSSLYTYNNLHLCTHIPKGLPTSLNLDLCAAFPLDAADQALWVYP